MNKVQVTPRSLAVNTTSVAITFTTPPVEGNGLVVLVNSWRLTASEATCADNRGNTYILGFGATNGLAASGIFYCPLVHTTGAPFTITLTSTSGIMDWQAFAVEIGGLGLQGLIIEGGARGIGTTHQPITDTMEPLEGVETFQAAIHAIAAPQTSITLDSEPGTWTVEFEELADTQIAGEAITRFVASSTGTTPQAAWTDSTILADWTAVLVAFYTTPVLPFKMYPNLGVPPSGPRDEGPTWGYFIRGPWEIMNRAFRILSPSKFTGYNTTQQYTRTSNTMTAPYRHHMLNFVTPPLKAQTISGTMDLVLGLRQSLASMNARYRIIVWVSAPYEGPAEGWEGQYIAYAARGVLLDYTDPVGRYFPTATSKGWGLPGPLPLTTLEVQDNDYLVIEVGYVSDEFIPPTSPTRSVTLSFSSSTGPPPGGTENPDLTAGSLLVSTRAAIVAFSNEIQLIDPPLNDDCSTPTVITSLPYDSGYIMTELATYDPATDMVTSCHASGSTEEGLYSTTWWQWTADATGIVRLEGFSAGSTSMTVYTGTCGALTEVACKVGYNGSDPLHILSVTEGATYLFRIGLRQYLGGSFQSLQMRWTQPIANDMFVDRTVITLPYYEEGDMTLATGEPNEPVSPADSTPIPGQSIWYEWTADSTPGNVRVNTMGSAFHSSVSVWRAVPMTTFPLPVPTELYDAFKLPDQVGLFRPWLPSTAYGGVSLNLSNGSAVSNRTAPLFSGNYWDMDRYGYLGSYELWGRIRGDFTSDVDVIEIDALTVRNPAAASRNGFWVKAYRNVSGYHAQLGRWNNGVPTILATSILPDLITGLGIRRLGTTYHLWVRRNGAWTSEATVTDTNFQVDVYAHIGIASAFPGSVAFEEFGGGTLATPGFHGMLWIDVFSAPWTNTNDEMEYYDQANMVFTPVPGTTYYITILTQPPAYWNNYGGNLFKLEITRVPSVPNETVATAQVLPEFPFYEQYDITNAADGPMEITHFLDECDYYTMEYNDSGKVLWFKWTATSDIELNLNTHGPTYGKGPFTELILLTGPPNAADPSVLVPIMCDSFNLHQQTQLIFRQVPGTHYYLRMTSQGRIDGRQALFVDEHWKEFQLGDVVISDTWMWLFAPNGGMRRLESIGYPVIPTGSAFDVNTGLLTVAEWYGDMIYRLNGELEVVGTYPTAPGLTPEVPGFSADGRLYVGHWGDYSILEGQGELVHPSFAIRQFDPNSGALIAAHPAKQEVYGSGWLDPHQDQKTIHYTSLGRKIMSFDVQINLQGPDVVVPGTYPRDRARGIRHTITGDFLVADAAEVKRVSPEGAVLQVYQVGDPPLDDINVLDQSPDGTYMYIGDQDSDRAFVIDIVTGEWTEMPGGPFYATGTGSHLCGISVIGGFRAGTIPEACEVEVNLEPAPALPPWAAPAGDVVAETVIEEGFAGMLGVSAFGELSLAHTGLTVFKKDCP